jgi:ATP-dependent Lon protease
MSDSEDIVKINKKIIFFNNIIQQTILHVKKNKSLNILKETDVDNCIYMLINLNKKINELNNSILIHFNKDIIISQLQVINNDMSSILKLYGTDSFENLLLICFGNNKYINTEENNLKYELLKKYFHPTSYKVLNNETNEYTNFECHDIILTHNEFHYKLTGIKVYIYNSIINKYIIIYGILDCVVVDLLNDKYINNKKNLLKQNIPSSSIFKTTNYEYFFNSLNLKDFIIHSPEDIYNKFIGNTYLYKIIKNKSLNILIKDFLTCDLYSKRNLIILLLYHIEDSDNIYLCNVLFDLLSNENSVIDDQTVLYESFPISIKNHFNNNLKKILQETNNNKDINSVSFENKIHLMKTTSIVKDKAFSKLKEIKLKSDDSCQKARNYLEGLLKIPFGNYKKEQFLEIMDKIKLNFNKLIENNILDYKIPIQENYTSLEISYHLNKINTFIQEKYTLTDNDIKNMKKYYIQGDKNLLLENINKINNINAEHKIIFNKKNTKQELKKIILDFIDENINNLLFINQLYILIINNTNIITTNYDSIICNTNKINNDFKYIKNYISNIRGYLDNSVYGHDNAKTQIEKIICQWLNGEQKGYCFGFEGSPGVGKTSLAKKGISDCLKDENGVSRPFTFIKMGGDTNGSTLHGHNYTYVGSTWGAIVQVLMDTQVMNPIIFIDEVDKISKTEHGREIIGILTHLLDFTQNDCFQDKYYNGIDLDLSKALFILSYNDPSLIDRVLLDRIHRIKFNHLSLNDKIVITNKYLLPEILNNMGLTSMIKMDNETIIYLIENYTIESGVRKLKELLFEIIGEININIFKENIIITEYPIQLTISDIKKYLKDKSEINPPVIFTENKIGVVNGMWANSLGQGGILQLFSQFFPGQFFMDLKLTGSLEKVMSESVHVAQTLSWNLTSIKRREWFFDNYKTFGIHIHAADGSISKDGPSGGVALTILIYSLLNDLKIKQNIGITGEIDLDGNVCEIGGLDLKILGSLKSGINHFIFPKKNNKDYLNLIEKYKDNNKFENIIFSSVERIEEVFEIIFDK